MTTTCSSVPSEPKLVFGLSLRNAQFSHHPPALLRLNNGSFGACPRSVLNFQSGIRNQFLSNPDLFCAYEFQQLMIQSRKSVADYIRALSIKDVVLVDNMSVAATIVAEEALRLTRGDGDGADDGEKTKKTLILPSSAATITRRSSRGGDDCRSVVSADDAIAPAFASNRSAVDQDKNGGKRGIIRRLSLPLSPTTTATDLSVTEKEGVGRHHGRDDTLTLSPSSTPPPPPPPIEEGGGGRRKGQATGGRGGVILISNFTHGSVVHAMEYVCLRSSGRLRMEMIYLPFPIYDPEELIRTYEEKISHLTERGVALHLAVLDHVSSLPAVLFPVVDVVNACRQGGFRRIFVDGSHALGTVANLDVPSVGADYYAGTVHKWMFAPTSAAFLWISPKDGIRDEMHHPIPSHGFNKGLAKECAMIGTRDYSSLLSVPAALEFFKSLGGGGDDADAVICRRNHDLVLMAAMELADLWCTELGTSEDMCTSMVMVGLPQCLGHTDEASHEVKEALLKGWNIVVHRCYPAEGRLWLRLSAAVYNHRKEFDMLGEAVLELARSKEMGKGEEKKINGLGKKLLETLWY